jgi:hypothetical protein
MDHREFQEVLQNVGPGKDILITVQVAEREG